MSRIRVMGTVMLMLGLLMTAPVDGVDLLDDATLSAVTARCATWELYSGYCPYTSETEECYYWQPFQPLWDCYNQGRYSSTQWCVAGNQAIECEVRYCWAWRPCDFCYTIHGEEYCCCIAPEMCGCSGWDPEGSAWHKK